MENGVEGKEGNSESRGRERGRNEGEGEEIDRAEDGGEGGGRRQRREFVRWGNIVAGGISRNVIQ